MNKVVKTSRFFKKVFMLIFCGWPIVLALIWFLPQQDWLAAGIGLSISNFIPAGLFDHILTPLSGETKAWGFLISFIPMAIGMMTSWLFIRLFQAYEHNEIFSLDSIRILKKIALVMIIGVLLDPVYQALISFVMTAHNPPGWRIINIAIGTGDIRALITAGLIYLITYIMQEGAILREEQALTV